MQTGTSQTPTSQTPTSQTPTSQTPTSRGWGRGRGAVALVLLIGAAGCTSGPTAQQTDGPGPVAPRSTSGSASAAVTSPASSVLAGLAVKGRAPMTGYSRAQFGQAWTDDNDSPLGHNGCDTRNDVLRRDLTDVVLEPGTSRCVVLAGVLHDPYTGSTVPFARGATTSARVQIDHVVALGDAWQTGARLLSARARVALANDPLELLAVDGVVNQSKGDGDAATWLPPARSYRCAYVARQVAVKARYHLWMTPAEHDAVARVLARCPGQTVPGEAGRPDLAGPRPGTSAPSSASTPSAGAVSYANCAAVRAAGAAPLVRGRPGYSARLDRNGDGVACEP